MNATKRCSRRTIVRGMDRRELSPEVDELSPEVDKSPDEIWYFSKFQSTDDGIANHKHTRRVKMQAIYPTELIITSGS